MEERQLRLAKPKLKGIWGLVFSRLLIVAILIVLQIVPTPIREF